MCHWLVHQLQDMAPRKWSKESWEPCEVWFQAQSYDVTLVSPVTISETNDISWDNNNYTTTRSQLKPHAANCGRQDEQRHVLWNHVEGSEQLKKKQA